MHSTSGVKKSLAESLKLVSISLITARKSPTNFVSSVLKLELRFPMTMVIIYPLSSFSLEIH